MAPKHETPAGQGGGKSQKTLIRKGSKIGRVLEALAEGRTLNRFEATRQLHDWTLHSTVSALEKHGISVARQYETVPGYQGHPTRCRRYWLEPDQRERARKLLGGQ